MVAPTKIRCAVVTITADDNGMPNINASEFEPRFRPSDLLPWADPYIAGLVRKLQAEVRSERQPTTRQPTTIVEDVATLRAELEPSWSHDEQEIAPSDRPTLETEPRFTELESVG